MKYVVAGVLVYAGIVMLAAAYNNTLPDVWTALHLNPNTHGCTCPAGCEPAPGTAKMHDGSCGICYNSGTSDFCTHG